MVGEEAMLLALRDAEILSFNDAIWLDVFGNGFVLSAMIMIAAGFAASRGLPLTALTLALGYATLFLPVVSAWVIWGRARPLSIEGGIGSPGASISSFPSGHLVQAVVAFGLLWFLWIRVAPALAERLIATLLFLLVVMVTCVARLRLGAHWPTDMVAAILIGCFWLAAILRALVLAEREAREERQERNRPPLGTALLHD
jgi:membrane-associated phospholipid phosphatase